MILIFVQFIDENSTCISKQNILKWRRHIWDYSVCLCLIKGTPGLNGSTKGLFLFTFKGRKKLQKTTRYLRLNNGKLTKKSINGLRTVVYTIPVG